MSASISQMDSLKETSLLSPILAKYLTPRGHLVLDALAEVAAEAGATPAQVAIAWLLAKPVVASPIASATSFEQLDDLVKAAGLRLPPGAVAKLDAASA